jgi:SAM-dependent methyltransferase
VAKEFLRWLSPPARKDWLDVGCGTGALTQTILEQANPYTVTGVDPSPGFIDYAGTTIGDPRVSLQVGDAQSLRFAATSFDLVVSGLMLNFVPQPGPAVAEMVRVTRSGGVVAAYVWDYAGKMELMRYFWDGAVALDPGALDLDEGRRFPICQPPSLGGLFKKTGLEDVEVQPIDISTYFRDFDDYWSPFLGGQGPAPTYLISLSEERRGALRERVHSSLPIAKEGSIALVARSWGVRGRAS